MMKTFTCPSCGGNRLEKITSGSTVVENVEGIEDGEIVFSKMWIASHTELTFFRCVKCNYRIREKADWELKKEKCMN